MFINGKKVHFPIIISGKLEYMKIVICATLERKWKKDLPGLQFDIKKFDEQDNEFNPLNYKDSKLFMEKLVKIKKHLPKRIIRQKRHKKLFGFAKPLRFLFFNCFLCFCCLSVLTIII